MALDEIMFHVITLLFPNIKLEYFTGTVFYRQIETA